MVSDRLRAWEPKHSGAHRYERCASASVGLAAGASRGRAVLPARGTFEALVTITAVAARAEAPSSVATCVRRPPEADLAGSAPAKACQVTLFLPFELSCLRCAPEAGGEGFYFTAVALRSGVAGEEGLPEGRERVCLFGKTESALEFQPQCRWGGLG